MGAVFCCTSKKGNSNQTPQDEEERSCAGRWMGTFGERALGRRFTGQPLEDEDAHLRSKALSFYDFDEDKSSLLTSGMRFDSEGDETESEFNSVDEGAIAVLTMDEIRNMR